MSKCADIKRSLVDVEDSVLVVIDIQDRFLAKCDNATTQAMVEKVAWLLQVAQFLGVPVVAMAEDMDNVGNLTQAILEALPEGTKVHNKNAFNLADNPEILAAVDATDRKTAILVGMETDVCVAHSALGLMEHDHKVVALKDGVATTAADEEIGLGRMHDAGAVISSVKALYFEWIRSVKNARRADAEAPALKTTNRPSCLVL